MNNTALTCRICRGPARSHFSELVLKAHPAEFAYCQSCDHIFAVNPTWIAEAYVDAIDKSDTDIATRNVLTAIRVAAILSYGLKGKNNDIYADVAGGYGLLTRLMRDLGFNYFWSDPYADNIFACGFEYASSKGACKAISAIEVLEHTVDPLDFIKSKMDSFQTDTFIFTTMTFPDGQPPKPKEWAYFSLDTGQHISFFSIAGLKALSRKLDMEYVQLGRIHMFTKRDISTLRLSISANRFLALPLSLLALRKMGSKRAKDRVSLGK